MDAWHIAHREVERTECGTVSQVDVGSGQLVRVFWCLNEWGADPYVVHTASSGCARSAWRNGDVLRLEMSPQFGEIHLPQRYVMLDAERRRSASRLSERHDGSR